MATPVPIRKSATVPLCSIIFMCQCIVLCGDIEYPKIESLSNDDILFKQLESQIEYYYSQAKKDPYRIPELSLYSYGTTAEPDIYAIAARTNIPYDTLATVNRVSTPGDFKKKRRILIPSVPGVFIPEFPVTDLEQMMNSTRAAGTKTPLRITIKLNGTDQQFAFFHGERFSSVERAYFLGIFFKYPLPYGSISSGFGSRKSPFGGHPEIHNGIDIAAPRNTEVIAVREGTVTGIGTDPVYGNFILLTHSGEYQSFYAHLEQTLVAKGQYVSSGTTIGKVGTSGRSTGPHLHFEIRKNGLPIDPSTHVRQVESRVLQSK